MASDLSSVPKVQVAEAKGTSRNPWAWVPTLYLAEGLPYVVVMTVSVIMYKGLGISNTDIALYTSWLYLPWVIKPLWSPVVDLLKTRRLWIWMMQLIIGAGFAGIALTIPGSNVFRYSLAFLWLLAFSSATHDIAADGFYMLATTEKEQSFFVGIRTTFYRISMISGQGLLVMLAGFIQSHTGLPGVHLQIGARPGAPLVQNLDPLAVEPPQPASDDLHFVVSSSSVQVSPELRAKTEIAPLIEQARSWNLTNGFTQPPDTKPQTTDGKSQPSWWKRTVVLPLENSLRKNFSRENRVSSDQVGNIGFAYVRLSRSPGKQVVTTITLASGDKSISLAEGSRLVFDDSNWNKPAIAVVQLDPKLKTESASVYQLRSGNLVISWVSVFTLLVALFLIFGVYHKFVLPYPARDKPGIVRDQRALTSAATGPGVFLAEFFRTFAAFFKKDRIGVLVLFLLFYRFAEAQLVKMVAPFLLDARETGGLGLTTGQVGFVYGTVGVIALTCGGLLGGMLASRWGLKFWLWPMVCIMHLPDAMFIYLAYAQPENFALINLCVAIEQFGYGFGFTGYMLYMIYIARGRHETAHYAICTGFMALGMMLPGMFSGWLQENIGYQHFFIWVMLATLPGFIVVAFIPLDPGFGRKNA